LLAAGGSESCRKREDALRERDLLNLHVIRMKQRLAAAILLVAFASALPLAAQAPNPADEEKLVALVKEVQTQQALLADNQTKIESKLAALAETIRTARLFAGKAGK
jgi:hypothetical protein